MARHDLLIGSAQFWARAKLDIAAARRRVLVQAMTFEGDATGLDVADAIQNSSAPLRRVAVDDYTRLVINDRWVSSRRSRRDAVLQAEVQSTAKMFDRLVTQGVEVTWTEPVRRVWRDYPFRNHRKIIVADDVAYIGGVNFSDHNFAWADLMVRMDRRDVADRLASDFPTSGAPAAAMWRAALEDVALYGLDGRSNRAGYAPLIALIEQARDEIIVFSPYLTSPFTAALKRAKRRGARIVVITAHDNNKPLVRDNLVAVAKHSGFQLVQTPGMNHIKAMLIDGRTVVLGSSNFDFASYHGEAEIVAVFDDPALALQLRDELIEPALAQALNTPAPVSAVSGVVAGGALRAAQTYICAMAALRRL